jgi:uncharacterized membrane protein
MKYLYEFQRCLARHRRRHRRSKTATVLLFLAGFAALATVAARCLERYRFLEIFASLVAYALTTTLIVAENTYGRAEHGLSLGGAGSALKPYLGYRPPIS